jgi:hypothetical protein
VPIGRRVTPPPSSNPPQRDVGLSLLPISAINEAQPFTRFRSFGTGSGIDQNPGELLVTLHKKTLLIVGLTLGVLLIGLIVASWTIVLGGFEDQESQDTQTNVERVLGALDDDLRQLEVTTRDWAEWNDTYRYMEDRNEAYIESNWVDGTLAVIGMNVALYVDTTGQVVLSKAYDLGAEEVVPVRAACCSIFLPANCC